VFKHDCGANCVQQAVPATCYGCASPDNAYYCPGSTEQLSAVIDGVNGVNSAVSFDVGNATALSQSSGGDAAMRRCRCSPVLHL
jgi:hypothetical protein